ncbi:hypothetical protein GJ842_14870 [Salmonella enterica]|uniref:hypothetical protein n=1 Tax=Salmonella enterica TaxID=28901 RepID=UPI0019E9BE75|nr:hypothetical protein [Salmonella enterica]EGO1767052.1 hypothetical protein [Salmonella enterica subsp. diarizonae serovar Rough:-:-]MCH5483925.1 hypothetical protein [Salmonella enterica subsp. diarizonae serovar 16:z10:e,n,x,z15]EDZ9929555.1 hypothetical protein [Salmonella enterica]EEH0275393.1 hypothetical protein [Salmonella enterica]
MSSPLPSSFWCRSTLVILSLFALSACTTVPQPQRSLPAPEKKTCDMKKGVCAFSWKIFVETPSKTAESINEIFAAGSSTYPVNNVTAVPFWINHGEHDNFAGLFNIVSESSSTFSFVTISGDITRGKANTVSFSQKIRIPSGGTGSVRVPAGDETFIISVTAPTFTTP